MKWLSVSDRRNRSEKNHRIAYQIGNSGTSKANRLGKAPRSIRWLFVIARNSSFTYKVQAIDINRVGRELGVRYLLGGSVRRSGNRVRIAGQLIATSRSNRLGTA